MFRAENMGEIYRISMSESCYFIMSIFGQIEAIRNWVFCAWWLYVLVILVRRGCVRVKDSRGHQGSTSAFINHRAQPRHQRLSEIFFTMEQAVSLFFTVSMYYWPAHSNLFEDIDKKCLTFMYLELAESIRSFKMRIIISLPVMVWCDLALQVVSI